MQNRLRRSKLELRGSKNGLRIGPIGHRRVRYTQLLALIPNLTSIGIAPDGSSEVAPRWLRGGSEVAP
eukprot:14876260-Alexandrium_andersonii.AAC.1